MTTKNGSDYRDLYNEAADILSGYNRVRTYNKEKKYFYKDENNNFIEVTEPQITDLDSFVVALKNNNGVLYVQRIDEETKEWVGVADGFNPATGITSLEEYFSWLKILGAINRKYTILPLDEPAFEINANTRAILIPNDFKKNGVAVQGDDLAEVLYFKIDRYFDYMDLNNCDIFIQWEAPKNANGEVVKSASPAYIRDIESEPGKLIFGWILDDAITATAGNLKFSVRFYQWEDAQKAKDGTSRVLAYSFSTLTAQVAIHPSINFNPEIDVFVTEDLGQRLLGRIKDSEIVGGYIAHAPVFLINLLDDINGYDYGIAKTNAEGEVIFTGEKLRIFAKSPDTGNISYTWQKQDLETGEYSSLPNGNEFIEIPEEDLRSLSDEFDYWTMNGEIPVRHDGLPTETEIQNGIQLFKRVATCEIDSKNITGIYWGIAENRMTNSATSEESVRVTFPAPKEVVVSKAPSVDGNILVGEEDALSCNLSILVEEADSTIQKKRYEWYYNDDSSITFNPSADEFSGDPIGTEATLTADKEGHYLVKVYNKRNGIEKELAQTVISRVTKAAKLANILEPTEPEDKVFALDAISELKPLQIKLDGTIPSDKYTVYWYHKDGTYDPVLIETQVLNPRDENGLISKFNPTSEENANKIKEGSLAVGGNGDLIGTYYPIIVNNLNGSTSQTAIPEFADMFKVI